MHAIIINGSPRVAKFSNTEKILDAFTEGMSEAGATCERYAISARNIWDKAREAFSLNQEIIIALPLYVESAPGLLLEFLETLPVKDKSTRISFILQGGFAEASQFDCGKEFLRKLPGYLGASYGGTLYKGDNFGIRMAKDDELKKLTGPYREMGKAFVEKNGFDEDTVRRFGGPDYLSRPMRLLYGLIFRTLVKKRFAAVAKEWGCTVPIDYKPWA